MDYKTVMMGNSEYVDEVDVLDFLRYAFKKWWIIAAASLAGFLAAVYYVTMVAVPIYEATTQLYVVNSKESVLNLSDLQIGTYLTNDYQLLFQTWEVNQQIVDNLDLPYSVTELKSMIEVTNPGNTRTLFIKAASADAKEAAAIANEAAQVAGQYIADTMLTEKPTVLSTAREPLSPAKPRKKVIAAIGLMAGLCLSVWALFIVYAKDDKINTSADVMKYTGALPLAVIPTSDSRSRKDRGR